MAWAQARAWGEALPLAKRPEVPPPAEGLDEAAIELRRAWYEGLPGGTQGDARRQAFVAAMHGERSP